MKLDEPTLYVSWVLVGASSERDPHFSYPTGMRRRQDYGSHRKAFQQDKVPG